jgi:Rrf2 family transcriptional regulator, nitric oxide-sensitive transcriptional repressor
MTPIHFSEASNLAIHALAFIAISDGGPQKANEIGKFLGVSISHLGKVLQRLAKTDILESTRGAKGGFSLLRKPEKVSVLEIIETIDGPINKGSCLLGKSVCEKGTCLFGNLFDEVAELTRKHLGQTYLSDFVIRASLLDNI